MVRSNRNYLITSEKVLSLDEEANLRKLCSRHLKVAKDLRDALMITMLLDLGVRAQELLNIRVGDFNPDTHAVFIRSLKGSNARELYLKPGVAAKFRTYVLETFASEIYFHIESDRLVFDISYHRLWQIWGIYTPNPRKTIHSTRHTFAIRLYERTKDIKLVQMCLGHRSIMSTMVYVDFWYSQNIIKITMTK